MRVAHIILVHKKPDQTNAFVRQLAGADVYLHIDAKCPPALCDAIGTGPNVTKVAERVSVDWGDFNMIEATLAALRAVRASGHRYDYVTLNSGQDLLVREGLHDHLAAHRGRNFMEATRFAPDAPGNFVWRMKWPKFTRGNRSPWHWARLLRMALRLAYARGLRLLPASPDLPSGWAYYSGSQWFCLTGETCNYILDFLDRHPAFDETFRHSIVPDQAYFQTIVMNSPHAATVTGDNLTYLNFGKTFRNCNSPVTLTAADIPAIEASGRFFARKFEQAEDPAVIEHFCQKLALRASVR